MVALDRTKGAGGPVMTKSQGRPGQAPLGRDFESNFPQQGAGLPLPNNSSSNQVLTLEIAAPAILARP
jgi:hypothetical protein